MRIALIAAVLSGISGVAWAQIQTGAEEAQQSPAFEQGAADRQGWEDWFGRLSGDYRSGAEFWAAHRSIQNPGSCYGPAGQNLGDRTRGCVAAQQRLATSDVRRKTEPDYWRGWNSPPSASEAVAPPKLEPVPQPETASSVAPGYIGVVVQPIQPSGALIVQVHPNSPAEQAGLKPGDVIGFLNGMSIGDARAFGMGIGTMKPGAQAKIAVIRNGIWQAFTVTIGVERNCAAVSPGASARGAGARRSL